MEQRFIAFFAIYANFLWVLIYLKLNNISLGNKGVRGMFYVLMEICIGRVYFRLSYDIDK